MRKDILKAGALGLTALGAGFGIGYFVRDKMAKSEIEALQTSHDENLRAAREYYDDKFEREVENRAKDLLAKAAERRSTAYSGPQKASDDSSDGDAERGQEDAVEGPSEVSESPSEHTIKPVTDPSLDVRRAPEGVLINQNIFDRAKSDPTEAVDYTRYAQNSDPQVIYGQKLLQDDRQASENRVSSGGRDARADLKRSIREKNAEDDLDEWMRSHDPSGYPIPDDDPYGDPNDLDRQEPPDSLLTPEELAEADSEFDYAQIDAMSKTNPDGAYFISEAEYSNTRGFDKQFVMYCDVDNTWCDEDLNKIEDNMVVVGKLLFRPGMTVEKLFEIGAQFTGEEGRFYIRNTKVGTDYEVMRYHRAFYDMMKDPR